MQKYLQVCDFFCNFGHLPCSAHLHSLRNSPELTFAKSGVYPNFSLKKQINSFFFAKKFVYVIFLL